jgi:DNA recombination protein RmuC
MDILFFILILIAIGVGFALVIRTLKAKPKENPADDNQALVMLQNQIASQQSQLNNQINELSRTLDTKLGKNEQAIREQFGASMKIVGDVRSELTKVIQGNQQVLTITDQLKNLQDILKNPKQRGTSGEVFLGMELENILPPGTYQLQYHFKDGTAVDAVVITKDGLIPIDSKFSLENYNRIVDATDPIERARYETAFYDDLKRRIDETSKYIKPEEKTLDFAFMFIPSEMIYYDLLNRKVGVHGDVNLMEYAFSKKKVIIVSPTTFIAYLQTVYQGLKRLHVEETAKKIVERVNDLTKHLVSYQEYLDRLGRNLGITVSSYSSASKEFKKIDKDIIRITDGETSIGVQLPVIEKPSEDDGENL